jgi:hypothetical protein
MSLDFPKHWSGTELISSAGYNADINFFASTLEATVLPLIIETFTDGVITTNDVIKTFVVDDRSGGVNVLYSVKAKFRSRSSASTFSISINGTSYAIFASGDAANTVKTIDLSPVVSATNGDQITVKVAGNAGGYTGLTLALFGVRTTSVTESALIYALDPGTDFETYVDGPVFGDNLDELWNRLNQLTYSMLEFSWYRHTPSSETLETFIGVSKRTVVIDTVYLVVGSGANVGSQIYDLQLNGATIQTLTVSGITPPGYTTVTLDPPIELTQGDKLQLVNTSATGSQRDVNIQLSPAPTIHDC